MNLDFNNEEALAEAYPVIEKRLATARWGYNEASQWAESDGELRQIRVEIDILQGIINSIDNHYLCHYFSKAS